MKIIKKIKNYLTPHKRISVLEAIISKQTTTMKIITTNMSSYHKNIISLVAANTLLAKEVEKLKNKDCSCNGLPRSYH